MNAPCKPNLGAGSASSRERIPCDPGDWDLEIGHSQGVLSSDDTTASLTAYKSQRCLDDYFYARGCRKVNASFGVLHRVDPRLCNFLRDVPYHQCFYSGAIVRRLHGIQVDMAWVSQQKVVQCSGESGTSWHEFAPTKDKEWRHTPYFIYLFALCIFIIFLVDIGSNNWSCTPLDARILVQMGSSSPKRIVKNNQWYRLLSSTFLHRDWHHVLGNIACLFFYGVYFEQRHGTRKVLFLSLVGSIGAHLFCSILVPNGNSIGASCVVYALIGMNLADIWTNWDMLTLQKTEDAKSCAELLMSVGLFSFEFCSQVILPVTYPDVNHVGHMGALLSGLFFALPFIDHMKSCSGIFGDLPRYCHLRLLAARLVCFTTATLGCVLSILFLWRSKVTPDIP